MSRQYEIIYFKPSGKYYTSQTVWLDGSYMEEVCDNFKLMLRAGKAPGLSGWNGEFTIVIMPIEPTDIGYPCMIRPENV